MPSVPNRRDDQVHASARAGHRARLIAVKQTKVRGILWPAASTNDLEPSFTQPIRTQPTECTLCARSPAPIPIPSSAPPTYHEAPRLQPVAARAARRERQDGPGQPRPPDIDAVRSPRRTSQSRRTGNTRTRRPDRFTKITPRDAPFRAFRDRACCCRDARRSLSGGLDRGRGRWTGYAGVGLSQRCSGW
jgi:hypothetical protein